MRKPILSLEEVKEEILKLKGYDVSMQVNKGRKRIISYNGRVEDVYKSVFVVKIFDVENLEKISFSFCDVLCGDVKIAKK